MIIIYLETVSFLHNFRLFLRKSSRVCVLEYLSSLKTSVQRILQASAYASVSSKFVLLRNLSVAMGMVCSAFVSRIKGRKQTMPDSSQTRNSRLIKSCHEDKNFSYENMYNISSRLSRGLTFKKYFLLLMLFKEKLLQRIEHERNKYL